MSGQLLETCPVCGIEREPVNHQNWNAIGPYLFCAFRQKTAGAINCQL